MQSLVNRRVWASFGLLLFLVTWRLWTPQAEFPQIPFFAVFVDIPSWVDWIAIAAVAASLLVVGVYRRETIWRPAMTVFAGSFSAASGHHEKILGQPYRGGHDREPPRLGTDIGEEFPGQGHQPQSAYQNI